MDPASAFSLACGVIQLAELGYKLAVSAKEIYHGGASEHNRQLEEQALQLGQLRGLVNARRPSQSLSGADRQENQELVDIARKCDYAAEELLVELDALKIPASRNLVKAFGKSLKARYKMSTIKDLQEEMAKYQKILDTRILIIIKLDNLVNSQSQSASLLRNCENLRSADIVLQTKHE